MEELIPSDAVKAIQESVKTEIITVDGKEFTTRPVHTPPWDSLPTVLVLHTLDGIVDFVKTFEALPIAAIFVESATRVSVIGSLEGRGSQRPIYARADYIQSETRFKFNQFQTAEDFIIGLQTGFVSSPDRASILSLVGNLKDENVKTVGDDGTTQVVTARQGISMVGEAKVPNPVSLHPYRTFQEVVQPASEYVLRLKKSSELPVVGLFETANPSWQIEAIAAISGYLESRIEGISIIA
jgi:hypothetical protein